MFLGVDGKAAGLIGLADTLKPNATEVVDEMHRTGHRGGHGHRR